jgi:uncharacterized protein YkwD
LASCSSLPETQRMPVSASLRPDASLTGQVLREVNSYRRSHGAMELQRHAGLDRLAQQHCEYLRQHRGSFGLYGKNVSHYGFEGRASLAREAFQMDNLSENVAATGAGSKNPVPSLVSLWANSKDHEFNMRNSWTSTGIGVVVDSDGTVFATQLFATVPSASSITRDRFNRF